MAETASGAPEEGARAIPFSVLAERLNAIHETHLLVELRGQKRPRQSRKWEGMSKPEMHIADFLHQADLLSREIYSHKDYCDDPRLKSPKMVSNPKRAGAFDVFRLLLPHLDTSRLYSLKEERLLKLLMRVYTLSDERTRSEMRRWKDKGVHKDGGNLAIVAYQRLFKESTIGLLEPEVVGQDPTLLQKYITIGRLNDLLDELSAKRKDEDQVATLGKIARATSPRQMMWVVRIIEGRRPPGARENGIFQLFHPAASERFQVCMDLRDVIETLADQDAVHAPVSITLGKAAMVHHPERRKWTKGSRKGMDMTPEEVFDDMTRHMDAPQLICENKFDGWRFQIHIMEDGSVRMFSRRAEDWMARTNGHQPIAPMLKDSVTCKTCILDCEWVAVDKRVDNYMALPFNIMANILTAIHENRGPDEVISTTTVSYRTGHDKDGKTWEVPQVKDILIQFIIFDVIAIDGTLVCDRPLLERKALLNQIVKPCKQEDAQPFTKGRIRGQILALTPERMPEHCTIASTREAVRQFFDATYLRGDEGLVVKDPYSQWVVGDMSGSWTKVKPDFNYTYEYDVVIVGARYGTHMGSRGELNNYIVAIRERMPEETGPDAPLTFLTFARVSNGFCVEDRKQVSDHVESKAGGWVDHRPRCLTRTRCEPVADKWVAEPAKGMVVTIQGDLRFVKLPAFGSKYSVRFPRMTTLRPDKPAADIETHARIIEDAEALPARLYESNRLRKVGPTGRARSPQRARRRLQVPDILREGTAVDAGADDATERATAGGGAGPSGAGKGPSNAGAGPSGVGRDARARQAGADEAGPSGHVPGGGWLDGRAVVLAGVSNRTAAARLVCACGGVVSQLYTPGALVISELGQDGTLPVNALAEARRNRSVLSLSWLSQCAAAGAHLPPRPRDFLHKGTSDIRLGSQHGLEEQDVMGDDLFRLVGAPRIEAPDLQAMARWARITHASRMPPDPEPLPTVPAYPPALREPPRLTQAGATSSTSGSDGAQTSTGQPNRAASTHAAAPEGPRRRAMPSSLGGAAAQRRRGALGGLVIATAGAQLGAVLAPPPQHAGADGAAGPTVAGPASESAAPEHVVAAEDVALTAALASYSRALAGWGGRGAPELAGALRSIVGYSSDGEEQRWDEDVSRLFASLPTPGLWPLSGLRMSVVQCAPSSDAHRGSANANAGADAGAGAGPSVEGLAPTASAQSAWATVADAAVVRGEAIDALALSLEARVAGAFVGPVSDQTTLVAVFCGSANQGTVPADALLSAVATQCGGLASLRTLSQRLASGEIVLARGDAVLRAVRGLVRGGQGKAGKGGPGVHRLPGALVGAVMEAVSEGDCLVEVSWEGRSWRCSAGREGLESVERWPWGKHGVDAPGTAAAVPALGGSVEPEEADGVGGVPDERGGASGAGAGVRDERGGASKGGVGVSEVWGLAGTGGASGSGVTATGRGGESKQGELQRMGLPIWNWPESGAGASGSGATETGCGGESGQGEVRQEVPRPSKRRLPGALSGDNGHALGAFLDLGPPAKRVKREVVPPGPAPQESVNPWPSATRYLRDASVVPAATQHSRSGDPKPSPSADIAHGLTQSTTAGAGSHPHAFSSRGSAPTTDVPLTLSQSTSLSPHIQTHGHGSGGGADLATSAAWPNGGLESARRAGSYAGLSEQLRAAGVRAPSTETHSGIARHAEVFKGLPFKGSPFRGSPAAVAGLMQDASMPPPEERLRAEVRAKRSLMRSLLPRSPGGSDTD